MALLTSNFSLLTSRTRPTRSPALEVRPWYNADNANAYRYREINAPRTPDRGGTTPMCRRAEAR
ncbi:MAG: hypothetical protein RLZZ436_3112 [Planctomycetota bacterium]